LNTVASTEGPTDICLQFDLRPDEHFAHLQLGDGSRMLKRRMLWVRVPYLSMPLLTQ
jgi:hypothetical protein